MSEPLSNRPKITKRDISIGYIMRYFLQHISIKNIIEVDKKQYDTFKNNPLYISVELKWTISGNKDNIVAIDGKTVYGVEHKNTVVVTWYNKKMVGLDRTLSNKLEYFTETSIR